jgi:hypothetical protein
LSDGHPCRPLFDADDTEPANGDVTWVFAYETDPFTIDVASLNQVRECKFYSVGATTAT